MTGNKFKRGLVPAHGLFVARAKRGLRYKGIVKARILILELKNSKKLINKSYNIIVITARIMFYGVVPRGGGLSLPGPLSRLIHTMIYGPATILMLIKKIF